MTKTMGGEFPEEAVSVALEEAHEPLGSRYESYFLRTRKFLLGGNAGGLVAVLSLASGFISPNSNEPLPLPLFGLVLCFAVGLSLSAVALFLEPARLVQEEERRVRQALGKHVRPVHEGWARSLIESYPVDESARSKIRAERWAFLGACTCLAMGSGFSAVVLFGFTQM